MRVTETIQHENRTLGQAALSYAAKGWPVFALDYVDESGSVSTTTVVRYG